MARCSTCHTLIDAGETVRACDECGQEYHQSCWDDMGGCATYGCKRAPAAQKPPPPVMVGQGWGDSKECPQCGMSIASSLLVCRCGARFPWADPMTKAEHQKWMADEASLRTQKRVIVGLFLASLFGLPAPLTGAAAGAYAWTKRRSLAGANGTYLALAAGSAALGVSYAVIAVLLWVGG